MKNVRISRGGWSETFEECWMQLGHQACSDYVGLEEKKTANSVLI